MTGNARNLRYLLIAVVVVVVVALIWWYARNPAGPPTKKTIKIGAVLPLTGEAAKYGDSSRKAIDQAVSEINDAGGVHGSSLAVVYEDDQATAAKGVSAFMKLVTVDKVPAVIGALPSSVTLAIAPIANKNKVVLLSPMSSNPQITSSGEYIFRNCISDTYEGAEMAKYASGKLDLKSIAILYINNDYGVGLRDVFTKAFSAAGGKIITSEAFNQGATDFRAQLTKIKAANPDGVYIVGYNEMIVIFRQIKQLGLKGQMLSTIMLNDQGLVDKMGGTADGTILTAWAFDPASKDAAIIKFVKAYKAKYGGAPDVFAAQAYDALKLIAKAMTDVGSTTTDIKKGLYGIKDYPGAAGVTSFDSNGDVAKPLRFLRISLGAFISVE